MSTIYLLTINLGLRIVGILQPATTGVAYVGTLEGYRGVEPYFWSLSGDSPALPTGLSLSTDSNGDCVISGTPTVSGTTDLIITITDATGLSVSRTVRIVVL